MFQSLWKPALFVCLCVLYVHGLAAVGLLGPDEPRYASIGREMARSGDWITPRLWGKPWFEKPVLLYWLIGAAYNLGFGDDWAPRIGVALLSLGFLLFFYFQLRREFGDEPAFYATTILATSAGWFAYSQIGVTDLPMSAAFAAAMLLALRWVRSGGRRGLLLAGILLGIAVLAKGLVPLVLALPLLWVARKAWRDLFAMIAGCVFTALPWYVGCYRQNGWPFIQEFILEHHFGRFASDALQHVQPFWFYVPILLAGLFPWSPLLVFIFRRGDFYEPRKLLLALWVFWGFVFFSVSTNKLPGYILPLLPAVAALIGIHLAAARSVRAWLPSAALLLGFVPLIAQVLPGALDRGLSSTSVHWSLAWSWAAAAATAAVCWWFEWTGRRTFAAAVTGIAAGVGILYLQVRTYSELDASVSARLVYARTRPECVDSAALRRQLVYGLQFYARARLPECQGSAR